MGFGNEADYIGGSAAGTAGNQNEPDNKVDGQVESQCQCIAQPRHDGVLQANTKQDGFRHPQDAGKIF